MSSPHAADQKLVRIAADRFLECIKRTEAAVEPFVLLLERFQMVPLHIDESTLPERSRIIDEAFARFASYLIESGELQAALLAATQRSRRSAADECIASAIRIFFLEPKPRYTYEEVRSLFSEDLANNVISECLPGKPPDGAILEWRDVAYSVFVHIPAAIIEYALGSEAENVLPPASRTRIVRLRLPQHTIDELEEKALAYGLGTIDAVIENNYGTGIVPREPRWKRIENGR
jgi:hypothetical protein